MVVRTGRCDGGNGVVESGRVESCHGEFDKCEEGGKRVGVIVQRPNPVPTRWWGRNSRCAVAEKLPLA